MFVLRVHSVDLERTISIEEEATGFTYALKRSQPPLKLIQPSSSLKITVRKGLIHFYRNSSHSSLSNPRFRSTTLFIVDPNYFSTLDFIRFCDSRIANVSEILFIRKPNRE
ncbi:PREDICTED: uncharacterized protein LOC104725648 isoform X2 [Camelina sativa]|uniref:Uncharacterized protein LOC104725648 isoform X2 n=1 Tax=Camelina sativa TaxID=90675 RepID=A0ABM1QVV6_CAMSA|nr:PREDICTED: uncharacterized protein LOC104725648 isoform X2 [Camelina sativa]